MEGKLADQLQQSEAEKEKLIGDMDQLRKDSLVEKEQEVKAARDKAREEYSETTFSCFYLIWRSNKNLNLDFLPEKTRAKELRKCLAREAVEAQGGLSDDTPHPSESSWSFILSFLSCHWFGTLYLTVFTYDILCLYAFLL